MTTPDIPPLEPLERRPDAVPESISKDVLDIVAKEFADLTMGPADLAALDITDARSSSDHSEPVDADSADAAVAPAAPTGPAPTPTTPLPTIPPAAPPASVSTPATPRVTMPAEPPKDPLIYTEKRYLKREEDYLGKRPILTAPVLTSIDKAFLRRNAFNIDFAPKPGDTVGEYISGVPSTSDMRALEGGKVFRRGVPFRRTETLYTNITINSFIAQSISSSTRFVCGVMNTAKMNRMRTEGYNVDYALQYAYLWSVYSGAFFGNQSPMEKTDLDTIGFKQHDPAQTWEAALELPDHDAERKLLMDLYGVHEARIAEDKKHSETLLKTLGTRPDRAAPYTRPNGEAYFPRKLKYGGKAEIFDTEYIQMAQRKKAPVLLFGEPGTGKTALCEAVLDGLVTLSGTLDTEVADFIGGYVQLPDGKYQWIDGPLVVAMEEGRPFLVDEIALIDPRALLVLYSVMDGRDELQITANPTRETVKMKEGFYVVGACNPNVPGAVMSDALLSRFKLKTEVTTDYDMAADKLGIMPEIITVAKNLARLVEKDEVSKAPQIRDLLSFQTAFEMFGREFALANMVTGADENDREKYLSVLSSTFGTKIVPLTI